MQLALRPWITASVALTGASLVALPPIAAVPPDVQVRDVRLTDAATDILTPYEELFSNTSANLQSLSENVLAGGFPALQQIIANQEGYFQQIIADPSSVTQIPGEIAAHLQAVINLLTNLTPEITTDVSHLPVQLSVDFPPAIDVLLGGIGPFVTTLDEIHDISGQLTSTDLTTLFTTLIDAPANILNAYLNGQDSLGVLGLDVPAFNGILVPEQPFDADLSLGNLINDLGLGNLSLGDLLNDLGLSNLDLSTLLGGLNLGDLINDLNLGDLSLESLLGSQTLGGLLGDLGLNNLDLSTALGSLSLGGLVDALNLGDLGLGTFSLAGIADGLNLGDTSIGLTSVLDAFGVGDTSLYTLSENIPALFQLTTIAGPVGPLVESIFKQFTLDQLVGVNSLNLDTLLTDLNLPTVNLTLDGLLSALNISNLPLTGAFGDLNLGTLLSDLGLSNLNLDSLLGSIDLSTVLSNLGLSDLNLSSLVGDLNLGELLNNLDLTNLTLDQLLNDLGLSNVDLLNIGAGPFEGLAPALLETLPEQIAVALGGSAPAAADLGASLATDFSTIWADLLAAF
jgi:hypothetical protein